MPRSRGMPSARVCDPGLNGCSDHSAFALNAALAGCRIRTGRIDRSPCTKGDRGMARTPALMGLLTGGLLLAAAAPAPAAPTVAQMLTFTPKQKDVSVSTPTAEEQAACKVELDKGSKAGTSGWVLKDGKGRPMRRFFDSTGTNRIDIWSYYKDGEEVYR